MAVVFILGIVGWAILYTVPAAHTTASQNSARYFGCILIVSDNTTCIHPVLSRPLRDLSAGLVA